MTIRYTLHFAFVIVCILGACTSPRMLPRPAEIGLNARGSFITIKFKEPKGRVISGELIAVEQENVTVLVSNKSFRQSVAISVENIRDYTLKYANPTKFDWTVPVFSLFSFTHGWFAIFSLPINLISTGIASGGDRYKYKQEELPLASLSKFARFPQGIPENVDVNSLE